MRPAFGVSLLFVVMSLVPCHGIWAGDAVAPVEMARDGPPPPPEESPQAGDAVVGARVTGGEGEPLPDEPGNGETISYRNLGGDVTRSMPRRVYEGLDADADAMPDRGIDTADTKWRRQARTTGVRMRMLNGPEANLAAEPVSSSSEKGIRQYAGVVVPLNPRWELAILNKFGMFKLKETGAKAGIDAVTLRVGANPSVSFRPWVALTPYARLRDGDGVGVGISGGLSKSWTSGISLEAEAYAWQPWEEGYETALHDGRSHGFRVQGTLPIDRRLTITAGVQYEWLHLGPHADGGSRYAGRRGGVDARVEYLLLKRDDSYMGYGFRDQSLWSEELVPIELGLFADIHLERYVRPRGFDALNPTAKSFRSRVGLFYHQAISPHLGFSAEAYVGQDPRRSLDVGDVYGFSARVNVVVSPHLRFWCGWNFESDNDSLSGGGGPDRNYSMGMSCNF